METPPSSPLKLDSGRGAVPGTSKQQQQHQMRMEDVEPTYENMRSLDLNNTVLDCVRLEERLYDLEHKQNLGMGAPLEPICERSSNSGAPGLKEAVDQSTSRSSSVSNTRSVSAAVSNESVAGDSGVFEAARGHGMMAPNRESAQIKLALRYVKQEQILSIQIERARNLWALFLPEHCALHFRLALLPSATVQTLRTATATDLERPVFGANFSIAIPLAKVYTKTLQISAVMEGAEGQRDECVGSAQISLAEFNANEVTIKWYNVLSFRCQPEEEVSAHGEQVRAGGAGDHGEQQVIEVSGVCKEESSDESTIISSQTSTLTRNQPQDEMIYETLISKMNGKLNMDSDDDEEEEDGEEGAVGGQVMMIPPVIVERVNGVDMVPEEDEEEDEQAAMMLAEYMQSVQNYADKETNTECGFLPEKALRRIQETAALSSKDGILDDRIVKRSQTFSPR